MTFAHARRESYGCETQCEARNSRHWWRLFRDYIFRFFQPSLTFILIVGVFLIDDSRGPCRPYPVKFLQIHWKDISIFLNVFIKFNEFSDNTMLTQDVPKQISPRRHRWYTRSLKWPQKIHQCSKQELEKWKFAKTQINNFTFYRKVFHTIVVK